MSRETHALHVVAVAMALLVGAGVWHQASGQETAPKFPEGPGLAAKYHGDAGLAADPAVVLVEDFEAPTIADVQKKYTSPQGTMELSDDVPAGSAGKQSLLMTHVGGKGSGGMLYRRLDKGYDQLFVRFYVKFDKDCAAIHHFFDVGGYNPATSWPQGGAGIRPTGDDRITVGVEPSGDKWNWNYYAYWTEMQGSPPAGQTWGNCFFKNPKPQAERDRWTCMEVMIKLNDPVDQHNGELALWKDGKLISHLGPGYPLGKWVFNFVIGEGGQGTRWSDKKGGPEDYSTPPGGEPFEGFRWRTSKELQLNFLWILNYITDAPQGHVSKVWFDGIVVSTQYVGPLAP
jgi:hypothetical protein